MALVSLADAKEYLRIDYDDEDQTISNLIAYAEAYCVEVARLTAERWDLINGEPDPESDEAELKRDRELMRGAILYAVSYRNEHREEGKMGDLFRDLRYQLQPIRNRGVGVL